jgi:membrane protease YdiL (CAAX protease family)
MNHPLLLLLMTAAGLYLGKLWLEDRNAARANHANPNALPGATEVPTRVIVGAVVGTVLLLIAETIGEYALGISALQSRMTWVFALYSVAAAPIIEEVIFRGWVVVEHRGRGLMWSAAIVASLIFALLHPFLWHWDNTGFAFTVNAKSWFSSAMAFAMSLWLYAVRLGPWNPHRSLLPCFAGHTAKNVGVVVVKAATGYMI